MEEPRVHRQDTQGFGCDSSIDSRRRVTALKCKCLIINVNSLVNLDISGLLEKCNTLIINPLWISRDFDAVALREANVLALQ